MSDVATGDTSVDTAVQGSETPDAPALSVKEHATLYSEKADALPEDKKAKLEEKAAHHSDQQRREKDGKFIEGKQRHRAQSQQARAEDVPRIKALTADKNSALERVAALEAEVTRLKTQHAPPAQVAAAERKVEQAEKQTTTRVAPPANDPEPQETDEKFGGDFGKYLADHARWAARDEYRQIKAAEAAEAQQAKQEEAKTATIRTFAERLKAAETKYDDFAETLQWDAPWLAANGEPHRGYEAIHDFILTDETGPDVLQSLRTHPEEVDALLQMPPLQQVKRLTLLGQRFASSPSSEAGATGAAPRQTTVIKLPPKPPTPVRTEASRVVGASPTDGTLSVLGHAKAFKYQR